MKRRLFIKRHFAYAAKIAEEFDEIIFFLPAHIKIPQSYQDKINLTLKEHFPGILFSPQDKIDLNDGDLALDFDSYNGIKDFGENLCLSYQNRLFDELPFDCPEGFSGFRKKAEKALPKYFNNCLLPFGESTHLYLSNYFSGTKPGNYFNTRNQMIGEGFSTRFSDLLSWGFVDVKYLFNKTKEYEDQFGPNKSTYWIIFELLWREFFYWHYQKHETLYFSENGLRGNKDFSEFKKYTIDELMLIDSPIFFRCALMELKEDGFLSNRVRQIFASIWLNDLGLPWRSGAHLFEEHLIDYDVYSNYGNWMYLAGVGVDPKGKRYFNLQKQLSMYDPENEYINFWSKKFTL